MRALPQVRGKLLAGTGNGELNVVMLEANMDVDLDANMNMGCLILMQGIVGKGVT